MRSGLGVSERLRLCQISPLSLHTTWLRGLVGQLENKPRRYMRVAPVAALVVTFSAAQITCVLPHSRSPQSLPQPIDIVRRCRCNMKNQKRLYLFGDQTNDFVSGLRQLLRIKNSPLLLSFLEQTHIALRQEISQQRREIQELLPRFSRVVDLLAAYSTELDSAPVLASTLTAIYQLGSFIRYAKALRYNFSALFFWF